VQTLHVPFMETIQERASRILAAPQDLSDLRAGDQVVIMWEGPNHWDHPLQSYIWEIDEASEERLAFIMRAGPDYKRYFDRRGVYLGCSWDDPYPSTDFAGRRLYRLSPDLEYLRLWRKLYLYVYHEFAFLTLCANARLRQLHRALHRLDPRQFQNELRAMQVEDLKVPVTDYRVPVDDPFLQAVLSQECLSDLGQVRVGSHLIWAHNRFGDSWRFGRIRVTRTTNLYIWVGEPEEARKFDRTGAYRNQTRLDGYTRFEERRDRLLLVTRETKQLLVRQQLLGDSALRRWILLRKLPVEGLVTLYQFLKTLPHAVEARQEDPAVEREIEQLLALLPGQGARRPVRKAKISPEIDS
jgi:hypothetical protein